MYKQAGAEITDTAGAWSADLVLHLRPPTSKEAELVGDRMLCRCDPPAVRPQSSFWLGGWGCCTRAAPRGGTFGPRLGYVGSLESPCIGPMTTTITAADADAAPVPSDSFLCPPT